MRHISLALLALAACDGGKDDAPPAEPTVRIVQPTDGATVFGSIDVVLELEGFELTGPEAAAARRRTPPPWAALVPVALAHTPGDAPNGYVEVRLDGVRVGQETASSFTVDAGTLDRGVHVLEVELLWPDGDAFFPAITDDVTVTVQ